jgi:hypothetical protein
MARRTNNLFPKDVRRIGLCRGKVSEWGSRLSLSDSDSLGVRENSHRLHISYCTCIAQPYCLQVVLFIIRPLKRGLLKKVSIKERYMIPQHGYKPMQIFNIVQISMSEDLQNQKFLFLFIWVTLKIWHLSNVCLPRYLLMTKRTSQQLANMTAKLEILWSSNQNCLQPFASQNVTHSEAGIRAMSAQEVIDNLLKMHQQRCCQLRSVSKTYTGLRPLEWSLFCSLG